jgi:hypothetical protein
VFVPRDKVDKVLIPAGDHPERTEMLMVDAECADGSRLNATLPFTRDKDMHGTIWEEFPHQCDGLRFFAPVRSVW